MNSRKGAEQQEGDSSESGEPSESEDQQSEEGEESEQSEQEGEQSEQDGEQQEQELSEEMLAERWSEEDEQAMEQWLKRIPDDPGGLLRRKFRLQHQRAGAAPNETEEW